MSVPAGKRGRLLLSAALLLCLLPFVSPAQFADGDVFVGVASGQVNWYSNAGAYIGTLNTTMGGYTTGMAFDATGNLYVTNFSVASVSKFNTAGVLLGTFGSGYDAGPESIVIDAAGDVYVGCAIGGLRRIHKFDAAGTPLAQYTVAVGPVGTDWIELGSDQCTMYYTSESTVIRRYDVCTNTQLPNFGGGMSRGFALRLLPDGGILCANMENIVRFNSAGAIIQSYDAAGENCWFALNLDPDGTSFWSADFCSSNVYRFDIATGAVLNSFNTGTGYNTVYGLAIFGEPTQVITCNTSVSEEIIVNENVTVDFNTDPPTYSGDADLAPYFTYDNTGATADAWKAIFDIGQRKLTVQNGATISTTRVPNLGNNRYAPGIEIIAAQLQVDAGGAILVSSWNKNAGDIRIDVKGEITINGTVKNEVTGTNGLPGNISVFNRCPNSTLWVGQTGLVRIEGTGPGGATVSLESCESDILVEGLVLSRALGVAANPDLNRPNIKVAAYKGAVTVNANSAEPLFDEHLYSGGLYDLWGGLLSWTRNNVPPGKVEVQALNDVTVNGHGTDPTAPARTSFGAIAAIATMSDAPGGLVDVRSIEGDVVGNDRAFDVSGRNRLSTNYARNRIYAAGDIALSRLGTDNAFNPVVDASSPSVGDKGGVNELRAYSGSIFVNEFAAVSADVPPGSGTVQGQNLLTYGTNLNIVGTVTPAPTSVQDNSQAEPDPLFTVSPCTVIGKAASITSHYIPDLQTPKDGVPTPVAPLPTVKTEPKGSLEDAVELANYPNPFKPTTLIRYIVPEPSRVILTVYDAFARRVAVLVNEDQIAGSHVAEFDATNLPGGTYVYKLEIDGASTVHKMTLLK